MVKTKQIIIGLVSILGTFVFLFIVYKLTNQPVKSDFAEINKIETSDHFRWNNRKNLLVEYSDFQCPACRSFHDFLNSIEKEVSDKTTLVYRQFPLYQIHPSSLEAAYAAEAAGLQGKFWEMGNKLFEKQDSWRSLSDPKNYFFNLASELKLDLVKFQKDLHSQSLKDKVQNDLSQGEKIGINETPTFFLNGKKVEVNNLNEFKQLLISL